VLIFQHTLNPRASDIENKHVRTVLVSWEKDVVTGSGDIYIGVWEGFRRWSGYIPALERKPDLQESRCIAIHSS